MPKNVNNIFCFQELIIMVMKECPKCGSTDIRKGIIFPIKGGQGILYWEGKPSIIMGKRGGLEFYPYACSQCGYMEFFIEELDKLKE